MRFLFLFALFGTAAHGQTAEILPPPANLSPFRWFASTDPKRQNDDFFLLKPNETRRVPLAAGTLERLWSTSLFPEQLDLILEVGQRRQVLLSRGVARRGLLSGKAFTFFPRIEGDSLAKLGSNAALVATNRASQPSKWYFQAAVRPQSPPLSIPKPRNVARRLFKFKLEPGEEKEVQKWVKAGEIDEISLAADVAGASTFQNLIFKASFDGAPVVDAPLLSLAGGVMGESKLKNAVADFNGSQLVLRWPMPFRSATISLKNEGEKAVALDVSIRVREFDAPPSPLRFCALQSAATTQQGRPVEILKLNGEGAFVGLALAIEPNAQSRRRTFAYLEGNERITADGKTFEGTGNEDFFSSAWYYPEQPFSHRFEGLTHKVATPPTVSTYRWMIPDAVPFKKSLHFDFEHGNGNNSADLEWKWTAIWYQKPPVSLTKAPSELDSRPPMPTTQVAGQERWKIAAAVGAGIFLGVLSAWFKRRRR